MSHCFYAHFARRPSENGARNFHVQLVPHPTRTLFSRRSANGDRISPIKFLLCLTATPLPGATWQWV